MKPCASINRHKWVVADSSLWSSSGITYYLAVNVSCIHHWETLVHHANTVIDPQCCRKDHDPNCAPAFSLAAIRIFSANRHGVHYVGGKREVFTRRGDTIWNFSNIRAMKANSRRDNVGRESKIKIKLEKISSLMKQSWDQGLSKKIKSELTGAYLIVSAER